MRDPRMTFTDVGALLTASFYVQDNQLANVTPQELSSITQEKDDVLSAELNRLVEYGYMSKDSSGRFALVDMAVA